MRSAEDKAGLAAFEDAMAQLFDAEVVMAVVCDRIAAIERTGDPVSRLDDPIARLDAMARMVALALATTSEKMRAAERALLRLKAAMRSA